MMEQARELTPSRGTATHLENRVGVFTHTGTIHVREGRHASSEWRRTQAAEAPPDLAADAYAYAGPLSVG